MSGTRCLRFHEDLVGLLEGTADPDLRAHVASCDFCRDARHDLEQVARRVARAGDDYVASSDLGERLASLAVPVAPEAASVDGRVSETRLRLASQGKDAPARAGRKARWLLLAACVSVGASAAVGFVLADRERAPAAAAVRAWHGKVGKIVRSGAGGGDGLRVSTPSGPTALGEGSELRDGMRLTTDARTRARLELDDGSVVVLDRATEVAVGDAPRTLRVNEGALIAEVAHVEGTAPARIETPAGEVRVLGTKLVVTAAADRTNVEVLRGEVEVAGVGARGEGQRVTAGQEGVITKDGQIDVAPVNDLAQRVAFGGELGGSHNEDAEAPASGLGELRARRPGRTDEKDHAVRLAKHRVKVRIAGNVARTEIDEEFFNDTNDELEGIYRFPLPPGAQIERLALEVDGKLLDGEFIDKAKAAAIWRGAIQNAAPKAPKPRDEIVWVPGPWHDPALLEWQRGGRFELKIFPIPKKASRRVVIAYTETIAPVSGVRRYVYPLPQGSSSKLTIDAFDFDAQIVGHDAKARVRVRGYELDHREEGRAARMSATMTAFTPSGDLAIEYSLDDRRTDASVWAYSAPPEPAAPSKKDADPVGTDPFVAVALRPKLPRWTDAKPRDQVIVVDAGRAMFGERFARAKRLAVQMTQEMDRRDRVTVLACDVTCRAMSGGFVAPGAPAAHDVDAFLSGVTADGASDLVAAVRGASGAAGRDRTRDLRVVLVSDGVATAGYRSLARVASEVEAALDDPRAQVVTVPIGADADVNLLAEVARGGGGVVVPYQPGQRFEATALEVLNATYGTTLRDVQLVLPDGLYDASPAVLPPLRAGSETIVTARMRSPSVKGEVVLRGKVGGDPFEARYPVEVTSTSDAGNAFVPRLFAASRIAEREREPGDRTRAELVALSRRFSVPSRFTSLLVLESEAMFRAFGIDRAAHAPLWTGEAVAQGVTVASVGDEKAKAASSDLDDLSSADESESKKDARAEAAAEESLGLGGAGFGGGGRGPSPAATMTPPPPQRQAAEPAKPSGAPAPLADAPFDDPAPRTRAWRERPPRGRFMKRIFVRKGTIAEGATPAVTAEKVAAARAAVQAAPDERARHKNLARALAVSGQLDELGEALERWSERDPLDVDVIVGRADLAARRGDREASLRILGGALASTSLSTSDAFTMAATIARAHERLGRPEACAFQIAAAEMKPTDTSAVARAVACERARGRTASADRWLAALPDRERAAVTASLAKAAPGARERAVGDIVVAATWEGGADLDVALLDPSGRRAGVATRLKGARIEGADARDHETLALATNEAGAFVVELVRASGAEAAAPVTGKVTIRAFGQSRTVPFTLAGSRVQVARVDVRWQAELVPVDGELGIAPGLPPFDRAAAVSALARVHVDHCGASGQRGAGRVIVTFDPSGRVSNVALPSADLGGTPAGRCVQAAFFSVRVPPFSGGPVQVAKSFVLQ